MKAEQVSFAAGEISPVLHARTDLTRYRIGLAELVNMIVLPQGGVTRRAGLWSGGNLLSAGVKLIPFEYNTTDSVMLEFGNKTMRVWQKVSASRFTTIASVSTPYALADVKQLRHVQSGNVMFLTHRNYKPMMLRRNSLTSWTLEELPYRKGPWISGEEWASGVKLRFSYMAAVKTFNSINGDAFNGVSIGTLLKAEYPVAPKTIELTSQKSPKVATTDPFEVKGTMNITTTGNWTGVITVERSSDGGSTWVTMKQYNRLDTENYGQWDFTISETEENILYRVSATHYGQVNGASVTPGNNGSGDDNSGDDSGGGSIPSGYRFPEHPDVEGGENYIYRERWHTGNDMVWGELSDGRIFYYSASVHQTFYVVGETIQGDFNSRYGYVVDGYPEGYDENGNYIGDA